MYTSRNAVSFCSTRSGPAAPASSPLRLWHLPCARLYIDGSLMKRDLSLPNTRSSPHSRGLSNRFCGRWSRLDGPRTSRFYRQLRAGSVALSASSSRLPFRLTRSPDEAPPQLLRPLVMPVRRISFLPSPTSLNSPLTSTAPCTQLDRLSTDCRRRPRGLRRPRPRSLAIRARPTIQSRRP